MIDLARYLTGMDLLKATWITEDEEYAINTVPHEMCRESDLLAYKNNIHPFVWSTVLNTFRTF